MLENTLEVTDYFLILPVAEVCNKWVLQYLRIFKSRYYEKLILIGVVLAFALLSAGCDKVNTLEDRVSALEDKTEKIEAAITQLQAAVDGKYAVDKVEEIENGYNNITNACHVRCIRNNQ